MSKTLTMNLATKPQIQKIQILLRSLGLMEEKETILLSFSNNNTTSTRELSFNQAKMLLAFLCDYDPKEKQIKAIRYLAYRCGIIYGDTVEDRKINVAKLNLFLKEKGTVKKDLHYQTLEELTQTHRQLSAIEKSMKGAKEKKQVHSELEGMLNELNIPTSTIKSN